MDMIKCAAVVVASSPFIITLTHQHLSIFNSLSTKAPKMFCNALCRVEWKSYFAYTYTQWNCDAKIIVVLYGRSTWTKQWGGETHCWYLLLNIEHENKCILLKQPWKWLHKGTVRYDCLPRQRHLYAFAYAVRKMKSLPFYEKHCAVIWTILYEHCVWVYIQISSPVK